MNTLSKAGISIKYARGLVAEQGNESNPELAASVAAEMTSYGYVPSKELFNVMSTMSKNDLTELFNDAIPAMKKLKGADVEYIPMYPNFPEQVANASDAELFINAIIHYWTYGTLIPVYDVEEREQEIDFSTRIELKAITDEEFNSIFGRIVSSRDSISETDKNVVKWFLSSGRTLEMPDQIPFKENLCFLVGEMIEMGFTDLTSVVTTSTDVLRIATHLSGGDISLASKTKFKSLNRKTRRMLVEALENVARLEDFNRHRGKWTRLFHSLHVGEYSDKLFNMAKKIRENEKINTFGGNLNLAIEAGDVGDALELLVQRPGEFARRLDHVLRSFPRKHSTIVSSFVSVADKIPTRNLMQLAGHFQARNNRSTRVVFPKGNAQKARLLEPLEPMSQAVVETVREKINNILVERFAQLPSLGKVYIDPALYQCPVPTQMRSASEATRVAARGTRIPIDTIEEKKSTLRFFIYWIGQDIDLSATFHGENFEYREHVSYTRLRIDDVKAYHSGDITRAPNGASEFIDIDIDGALKAGHRYIAMNVYVYRGPTFKDHKKVYAGWMTRKAPQSNEIYDPASVEMKYDLTAETKNSIPVIFDLKERKAIVTDLTTIGRSHCWGNNVESNRATIEDTTKAMLSLDNKFTLGQLFELHGIARGEVVSNRDEADVVFDTMSGDVTPFDPTVINSEYVV